ncbi:hypothetical protein [Oricola sp.]|uniref:hypothetical protein n=1 Tax=Oricola sp. TaxID=1979950 RepID=UPI0025D2C0AD|nr:hypothetical protein [Oricola sp.]MCI5073959.1 hypothetical protein [Oricola sp.]
MNAHTNIAKLPQSASAGGTKTPDITDCWSQAQGLLHRLHYLSNDLEHALTPKRATRRDGDVVTLVFTEASIDATIWLANEAWSTANKLTKALETLMEAED